MQEKKEKIDFVLEKNTARQLANVDWDRLNSTIHSRLDAATRRKTTTRKYRLVFEAAAALAAAAVIFFALTIPTDKSPKLRLKPGTTATVRLVESKGSAAIRINPAAARTHVSVQIAPRGTAQVVLGAARPQNRIAKAKVQILDSNGPRKEPGDQAAWIIISRPRRVLTDNGANGKITDLVYYLF